MLNYHSIAHDRCAEQLAQVEEDWRAVTAREEPTGSATGAPVPSLSLSRRPMAAVVGGPLRRVFGRRFLRPA